MYVRNSVTWEFYRCQRGARSNVCLYVTRLIFFATGIRFLFSFQMIPLHSNVQQVFNSVELTFCSTKITQDYKLIDSFLPVWIYADVFLWHLSSKVSLFFILIITPILLHASLKMREKVRLERGFRRRKIISERVDIALHKEIDKVEGGRVWAVAVKADG